MTNAMTSMDAFAGPSEPTSDMAQLGSAQAFRIRRRGARPLAFNGTELAMAMSFSPDLPYWYEINIYRAGAQRFVLAIRLFFQAEDQRDRVDARMFESMEEAITFLETYDAGRDVSVTGELPSEDAAPAELAAAALQIQAAVGAARQHFAGLVGELLSEIDNVAEAL